MQRILFCPGNHLIAYDWSGGRFGGAMKFAANGDGYSEFELYLQTSGFRPVHILVDLIEEEFHPHTVPHVWGSDRAAVLGRATKKYFRSGELSSLQVQKRQKSGRRDQEVLISGLGDASIVGPWIDILKQNRVPVKGIYSLPLVGQFLLASLGVAKKQVLLVSQQSPMTYRQSFYDHGFLKLSRLALQRNSQEMGICDTNFLQTEIDNTLQYLRSQRLYRRDEALEVCVLIRDGLFDSLDPGQHSEDLISYSVQRQRDVANTIGVSGELPTFFSDGLFAHTLFCKTGISNHYAPRELSRFYRYHAARKLLLATAGLVLVVGGVFAIARYSEERLLQSYTSQARTVQKLYHVYYRQQLGQAREYKLAPTAVQSAVETISLLEQYSRATPLHMLSNLARVLTRNSHIEITRVNWLIDSRSDFENGSDTALPRSTDRSTSQDAGVDYEIVKLEGEVVAYAGDFRSAVELFEVFVKDLVQTRQYSDVSVEKIPFDIDSDALLAGDSGTTANKNLASRSTFELRLATVRVEN
jgi:hypothetical protein